MLSSPVPPRSSDGFSLIELLVALLIAGVVGGVAVSGIVGGLHQTARTQDRIDAFSELQITVERMSREVRAADPITDATPDRMEVQVRRDGGCFRFVYELAGDELQVRRDVSADDCATFTPGASTPMVSDVINPGGRPLFTYQTSDGAPTTSLEDISTVNMEIVRDLRDQQPVAVSTVVNVRNAGIGS